MPLSLFTYSSFDRSRQALGPEQKEIAQRILKALIIYYDSNCNLEETRKIESRFFYKKLRKPYYEAGVESKIRIMIEREKSECFAVLAGNHDQIKRFLASL